MTYSRPDNHSWDTGTRTGNRRLFWIVLAAVLLVGPCILGPLALFTWASYKTLTEPPEPRRAVPRVVRPY